MLISKISNSARWSGAVRALCTISPLLLVVYLVVKTRNHISFERYLALRDIRFSDFEPSYAAALIEAMGAGHQPEYDFSTPLPDSSTIPPRIHYIWFRDLYSAHLDVSTIPTSGSRSPEACRAFNPDWNIKIWEATEARSLLSEHYAWFLPTYDSYPHPIQRVDAFKYFLLYHFGGIYMDLDVTCRRALNPVLAFPAWLPKAVPFGVNNDLMAARPGHPLMREMIDQLGPRNKNLFFPYLTIFWSTGPQFTSDILKRYWGMRREAKARTQEDDFRILPREFYSEEYTFFGHLPRGTWHGTDVAVVLWLVDRPWVFALAAMAILGAVLVTRRRRRRASRW